MAVPVLDTPLEIEEQRDFVYYFDRVKNGDPFNWGNATYELRIALDSAGSYPVMTATATISADRMTFEVDAAENKLRGSKKYYFNVVAVYSDGATNTEFKGIINCINAI